MKDNSVIFLKDWKPLVSSLSTENQIYFWELFTSYEYGVEQKCDNEFVKPIWNFIKSQLDNMKEKYNEKVVERNRTNGSKGGRPKKPIETDNNPKNQVGLSETQKTPKDKGNDNDNVDVNDNNNKEDSDFVIFDGLTFPKSHIEHSAKFLNEKIALETFMQQNKITDTKTMKKFMMDFLKHLNIEGKTYENSDFKGFKKHFLNWHRKTPLSERKSVKSNKNSLPADWLS